MLNQETAAMQAVLDVLQDSLRSFTTQPQQAAASGGLERCITLPENPMRYGANTHSVYTLLHPFSDPAQLDTFSVITSVQVAGGFKHELFIRTTTGAKYREELFAVPLEGVQPAKERSEELELLRVRMALSPDAFKVGPISTNMYLRFNHRVQDDLVYEIEPADFVNAMKDKSAIGFSYQSDQEQRKTLVFIKGKGIRNIEPIEP